MEALSINPGYRLGSYCNGEVAESPVVPDPALYWRRQDPLHTLYCTVYPEDAREWLGHERFHSLSFRLTAWGEGDPAPPLLSPEGGKASEKRLKNTEWTTLACSSLPLTSVRFIYVQLLLK